MKLRHFATVDDMVAELKPDNPVYCLRPKELARSAAHFLDLFPGRVLYAVKCNPHPEILKAFYQAGIRHFDTASLTEIATIRELFADADCYFMHPVKSRKAIRTAHDVYRVDHYVIDHEKELQKLVEVTGGGDGRVVIVRIKTPQHDAAFKLSEKFGIEPEGAVELLSKVSKEGFQTGLAFHVGSQIRTPQAFVEALQVVKDISEKANVNLHYLDVGGGFPASYVGEETEALETFVQAIRIAREKVKLRGDCTLMCEPGRAMVASGVSVVAQVHLRKDDALYINDGIYHSLGEALQVGLQYPMRGIRIEGQFSPATKPFRLFGPTCDSTDVLPYTVDLPEDIEEGDWIEMGQMGAYTNSMTTRFNGFFAETYVTVESPPLTPKMEVVQSGPAVELV